MKVDDAMLARLMALSQDGDRQAYSTLLVECQKWLKRFFARKIVPHQVDDLVQDTLLSLHRKVASYDPSRPFLPWLAAISRYRFPKHHMPAVIESLAKFNFHRGLNKPTTMIDKT